MSNFDKEYYFLSSCRNEGKPSPRAFHETNEREYWKARIPPDAPPLAFYNGAKRYNRERGIESMPVPPDVMFERDNLIVRKHLRDALLERKVDGAFTHAAWYVHDDKSLHDDYHYIGFHHKLDCWDRELSEHSGQDEDADPTDCEPNVWAFRLDAQLLQRIPLNQRLLFVMGGCFVPKLVCHESLLPLFRASENSGIYATLIEDY
jgi:hypothetical protein